jgi:hypothetical protein
MQDVGTGRQRQIRAVVDGQQGAVTFGGREQNRQRSELVLGLERPELALAGGVLVAQLDDVDATGQRGLGELREIALVASGIGTQVEASGRKTLARSLVADGLSWVHETNCILMAAATDDGVADISRESRGSWG